MNRKLTRRDFTSMLAFLGLGVGANALGRAGQPSHFKLGIITDEITEDFDQALDFISHYSLGYAELRGLWRKNIMSVSHEDLERAKQLLAQHRLRVSDIASPIFKYDLPEVRAHAEKGDTFRADFTEQDTNALLKTSFELAEFFGTNKVRIFSYWRVKDLEKAYPYVRDRLAKAAQVARQNGIILVLENEHSCNVGTGKELGRVVRDINSPSLRGNWDPGNAAMLNEVPYPDGYREVRGLFAHMHVKDVRKDGSTGKLNWAPVGGGFIDWRGQIEALRKDKYDGTISLETHYRRADGNKMESTRESLAGLLKLTASQKSAG